MTSFLERCTSLGAMPVGFLLDGFDPHAEGGTGKRWNWEQWQRDEMKLPWLLAGGLKPDNVEQAMRACRPNAVDVASGIESSPGVKDALAMRRFVEAVDRGNETLAEAGSALE